MARPLFSPVLVLFLFSTVWAKPYPEVADQKERQALDQLALEIDGIILYSRPPNLNQGEKKWMIDTIRIGEWKAETLDEGMCGRWSPDGKRIAVLRSDDGIPGDEIVGEIWLVNADGSGEKYLSGGVKAFGMRGACPIDFHPNNKEILFIREDGGISSVDIRTARVRDLQLPGKFTEELQLTGNGKLLVGRWKGKGNWAMNRRMVVVDLATKIHRVYGAGCCPAVSPDGNWMTVNHDGHYRMSICNKDIKHRVSIKSRGTIYPQHGWHNWHWSNHNDYLALKSEVYSIRKYNGQPDGFIFKFSDRVATRITFGQEAEFPDLYVSRNKNNGRKILRSGGKSISIEAVNAKKYDLGKVFRTSGETKPDPGQPKQIPRIVVEATLEIVTPLSKKQARKFRDCLVENVYKVKKVLKGKLDYERIIIAHWVMHNRKYVTYSKKFKSGRTYRFEIEPWYLLPGLKSVAKKSVTLENADFIPRFFDAGLNDRLKRR
ncbi:MAG: PD40 domain-containing protein [Deltaproteobacteria bacterium]|nr:PD40 domain-containing protein [Deltaproteobacteria bacterium]